MVTLWAERLLHVLHSLARFCLIAFVMLFLVSLVWEYSASTPGDRFPWAIWAIWILGVAFCVRVLELRRTSPLFFLTILMRLALYVSLVLAVVWLARKIDWAVQRDSAGAAMLACQSGCERAEREAAHRAYEQTHAVTLVPDFGCDTLCEPEFAAYGALAYRDPPSLFSASVR